jgi:hypothetical protein
MMSLYWRPTPDFLALSQQSLVQRHGGRTSMGWTSAHIRKEEAITELLRPWKYGEGQNVTTRKHTVRGSEMYSIHDVKDDSGKLLRSYILCTEFQL